MTKKRTLKNKTQPEVAYYPEGTDPNCMYADDIFEAEILEDDPAETWEEAVMGAFHNAINIGDFLKKKMTDLGLGDQVFIQFEPVVLESFTEITNYGLFQLLVLIFGEDVLRAELEEFFKEREA